MFFLKDLNSQILVFRKCSLFNAIHLFLSFFLSFYSKETREMLKMSTSMLPEYKQPSQSLKNHIYSDAKLSSSTFDRRKPKRHQNAHFKI